MAEPAESRRMLWRQRLYRLAGYARRAAPLAWGIAAAILVLFLYARLFPTPDPLTLREVTDAVDELMAEATPRPAYSSLVHQVIQPSLVLIQVAGPEEEDEEIAGGLGSGVVINENGDILTSLHVVVASEIITATFADGSQTGAAIVAAVPEKDIAVLQPTSAPGLIVPAVLGNPNALRIGDEAYAVGHPLGLYDSMSAGIISGFNRSFKPPEGEERLEGLIQFDAAVNPGNSGGPLLNRAGQVVGIVTGLVNPTDDRVFIGIGFAVPIDVAGGAAGLPPY